MPIPAAQNKTEISLILLSEHDSGEITSVEEYIPSVDFLIKKTSQICPKFNMLIDQRFIIYSEFIDKQFGQNIYHK